jgi:hypothetical protein
MTDVTVVPQANQWHKLKTLVLDSVSSPITRRVVGNDLAFGMFRMAVGPNYTLLTVPLKDRDGRYRSGCLLV